MSKVVEILNERLPLKELKYLSTISYNEFKIIGKTNYKNEEERKLQFNLLISICKINIKNKGEMNREYSYSSDTVEG